VGRLLDQPAASLLLPYLLDHFTGLCVSLQLGFREHQFVVDTNLEPALAALEQRDAGEVFAKLCYQFVRQPDGSLSVLSFLAVDNFYLQFAYLLLTTEFFLLARVMPSYAQLTRQ
jgi:hypothetical protein